MVNNINKSGMEGNISLASSQLSLSNILSLKIKTKKMMLANLNYTQLCNGSSSQLYKYEKMDIICKD